jgi:hypothetical protein
MADEDFDVSLHGDDEEGEIDTGVQLGFVSDSRNLMFIDSNWEKWDGGKVGGKPTWLDPIRIPHHADLRCKSCNSPMIYSKSIVRSTKLKEHFTVRCMYLYAEKKLRQQRQRQMFPFSVGSKK